MLLYSYAPISGDKAPLPHSLENYLGSASEKNRDGRHAALSLLAFLAQKAELSADAPVKADAFGRPFFDVPNAPFFNLSHSGALVAAAFGDARVGIDIQLHDGKIDLPRLAARFFSAEERQTLAVADSAADTFFELWTKKEALGKYLGTGLTPIIRKDTLTLAKEHGVTFQTVTLDYDG